MKDKILALLAKWFPSWFRVPANKPIEVVPYPTPTPTPVLVPVPVPAQVPTTVTGVGPISMPGQLTSSGAFGYGGGTPMVPVTVVPAPQAVPTVEDVPPIKRDPTKAWFGTEFQGPGSVSSVEFDTDGMYEVVVGYDVDRGNIIAVIPGVGRIHGGEVIKLEGKHTIVLQATGPGGSSVQLYKQK